MLLASASVLLLSGCSSAFKPGLSSIGSEQAEEHTAKGHVHGGQFAVAGSTVNVYAAATTGYGAASTLQTTGTAPVTNSSGNFNISYHCTPGQQLYLVATGGDPLNDGMQSTENNSALTLTAAMGPCGNLFTGISGSFNITEVTTVATEYALAGFSTGYLNVGSSAANTTGLANAFLTVTNLVNLSTGTALTVTPAYPLPGTTNGTTTPPDVFSSIVPADALNSIANSIASCVNTINSGATLSTQCSNPSGPAFGLFDYTGGNQSLASGNNVNNSPNAGATLNTADAVLYIAHNPGLPNTVNFTGPNNVAAFLNLAGATPPFASPVIATTPDDLSLTLNFVGGGMGGAGNTSTANSSYLAIDASDNIWVVNPARKTVSEFTNLGAPITSNTTVNVAAPHALITAGGYTPGFSGSATGQTLAIDLSGNVWFADSQANCLVGLTSSGTPLGPFPSLCPSNGAKGVAVDPSNNIWVASGSSTPYVFEATYSGGTASLTTGTSFTNPYTSGLNSLSGFIQADEAGNVWFADAGATNMDSLPNPADAAGGSLSGPTAFGALGPYTGPSNFSGGLAVMQIETGNTLQVINVVPSAATDPQPGPFQPESSISPTGIAVDGAGLLYIASQSGVDGSGVDVPANLTVYTKGLTEASPYNNGYGGASNFMELDTTRGVAIDQSGNVWVINNANGSAHLGLGPYMGDYVYTSGAQASNLIEFVGLAAPVNPVLAAQAKAGASPNTPTSPGAYGVRP